MSTEDSSFDAGLLAAERSGTLYAAVKNSSLAASLVDVETGQVVVTTESAARLLRSTVEDLVGRQFLEFSHDPGSVRHALELLRTGVIESYQAPRVVRRADGSTFQGRIWVRLAHDDGRRVFLLVFTDESTGVRQVESLGFVALPPELQVVPGLDRLTGRETEVLERLVAGARVPQIAEAMYLAPPTVRNHLSAIYRKLGVHSQAELVALLRPTGPEKGS